MRVAVNLCKALEGTDWETVILAPSRGFVSLPDNVEGVRLTTCRARSLIPAMGFSSIYSFALFRETIKVVRGSDIVHVHMGRDLVTLIAALISLTLRKKTVVHTHGMISADSRLASRLVDAIATRRILRRADKIILLIDGEREDLQSVARTNSLPAVTIANGVELRTSPRAPREPNVVLFAGRLAARKRVGAFIEAASRILLQHPVSEFVVAGPDEGELASAVDKVQQLGLEEKVRFVGGLSHDELLSWYDRASLYILPAVNEPIGLTILEAMGAGIPVIVSDSCGIAEPIRAAGAGSVVSPSPQVIADAANKFLSDAHVAAAAGAAGQSLVREQFSTDTAAQKVSSVYREVLS